MDISSAATLAQTDCSVAIVGGFETNPLYDFDRTAVLSCSSMSTTQRESNQVLKSRAPVVKVVSDSLTWGGRAAAWCQVRRRTR